ncbi:MAG: flagellar motor switch protein FliG [Desulfobulbaceae bacterium]|nr:flagellar motor switch protein FliG [Desulfobulbaceae bacterium]
MSPEKVTGLNKAATLLICLGQESASKILKELSDEEIHLVTRAMADINHIPNETRTRVLEDFQKDCETFAGIVIRGHDFAKNSIRQAGNEDRVDILMKRFISGTEARPLETISNMQPAMVAGLLEGEHPQTVALVLSTQTPDHAGAIISHLPEDSRADVVYRIATTEKVSPEVIHRIEDALHREIGIVVDKERRQVGGVNKVVDILDGMKNNMDGEILEQMEDIDAEMAEDIRKQMFTFEDLLGLDVRALQTILREINNDTLTIALKTASDELRDKIFGNISERAAEMIRDDLDTMGPVRLSEVESMQQSIVHIASRLEEEGKIILSKQGSDELV